MTRPLLAAVLLAIGPALACAQGPVYESKDKAGPVFSDRPSAGAKPVELGPPNVIQTTPPPKQQPAPATAPAPYYTMLAISSPENGGTIHSNTGAFDVSVRLQPALRTARGDRIEARLDGRAIARRFSSGRFGVTEADWQKSASPDNVEHTLQVVVLDKAGAVLRESAPVKFFAHRATRAHRK
jgi:hypothetical protein